MQTCKTLTLITPVYNEEDNLKRYYDTVKNVLLDKTHIAFNILFVDDGSLDSSWQQIEMLCQKDNRLKALRLSRNVGSHAAISAGLDHSTGDACAVLACDLQDSPETILDMVDRWQLGADIVFAHRMQRHDGYLRGRTSEVFNKLLARFAMPKGSAFASGSFLLADKQVVKAYCSMREHHCITFALMAWTGFRQEKVFYNRAPRIAGKTGWSFARLFKALYDAFIGFSQIPIKAFLYVGVLTFLASVILATYSIWSYFLNPNATPGWTSLASMIGLLFGIQFLMLSVMGEYLYRIYIESMRRPRYFVAKQI
jgi:glycosyltransferase involved in cell wall biosynthesis